MSEPQQPESSSPSAATAGLTGAEAGARLAAEGPNELPRPGRRSLLRIAGDVVREPMFAMLLGSALVYVFLGEAMDAAVLAVFASASVIITIVQESRGERVLDALAALSSPRVLVLRDGRQQRIPGREVVRGDLLLLAEGDRVAADVAILAAHELLVDEALLTGESVPVRKRVRRETEAPPAQPGGEDLGFAYAGSLVVRGRGLGEVHATGPRSEMGRIGQALASIEAAPARLAAETRTVVQIAAVAGLACSAATVVLYGLLRGGWLDALLAGIAVGMSLLPEEFPLVLAVFTVMGAWRISRIRVLTRRATAIETLGAASVLCTDKTGTLTENRMRIAAVWDHGETAYPAPGASLTDAALRALEIGVLASAPVPSDPMEQAFHRAWREAGDAEGHAGWALRKEYSLTPNLLAVTQVWSIPGRADHLVAAKGAPEAILSLCRPTPDEAAAIRRATESMAAAGLRVLALAEANSGLHDDPKTPHGFAFRWRGLVGLADPLRSAVPAAVAECRAAGIRVVMITGDHPATARAIATQAGIAADPVITGEALQRMDEPALARATAETSVFARILPGQKLRLVQAFGATGAVVAMTGDGVNDAPALKAADIGIAMGGRGTDVAREAAAIILLDDDFGSIVETIRTGRRIYDNLRKAMGYILAVHLPIAGLALLPLLTGQPLVLWPAHIAFLEMLIDPACSLAFEAEAPEPDVMRRPPRAPDARILTRSLVWWSLLQGALAFAVVAAVYLGSGIGRMPEDEVRALAFVTLILANLGLIVVNRRFASSPYAGPGLGNRTLWVIIAGTLLLLALALYVPIGRELFRFGPLHADDLAVSLAAVVSMILILELLKRLWRERLAG